MGSWQQELDEFFRDKGVLFSKEAVLDDLWKELDALIQRKRVGWLTLTLIRHGIGATIVRWFPIGAAILLLIFVGQGAYTTYPAPLTFGFLFCLSSGALAAWFWYHLFLWWRSPERCVKRLIRIVNQNYDKNHRKPPTNPFFYG